MNKDPSIELLASGAELVQLLSECALPTADISPVTPVKFFGIREEGTLAATIGLELYDAVGLLRSLAVLPAFRKRGFASELVTFAESFAVRHGVESMFLLTDTAEPFFLQLGYVPTARDAAPAAIRASSQFSELCPASAALLSKDIAMQD